MATRIEYVGQSDIDKEELGTQIGFNKAVVKDLKMLRDKIHLQSAIIFAMMITQILINFAIVALVTNGK